MQKLCRSILLVIILILSYSTILSQVSCKKITFKLLFNKEDLILSTGKYITKNNDTVNIDVFRCYVTAVKLQYEDGKEYLEKNSYHLLDAEETSTLKINLENVPDGKIKSIEFNIGVDSLESVSGALAGDLDPVKGMYWAWNSGYINLKLEGKSSSCKTLHHAFEFHIGGYLSPYKTLRHLKLDLQNNKDIQINIDLGEWINTIELSKVNSIMIPGKQAVQMSEQCKNMFSVFGQ